MAAPDRRPRRAPACALGVTGQRVRRALPPIPPPPAFRKALKEVVSNQRSAFCSDLADARGS